MAAPLARILRTPTVAERGIDTTDAGVQAVHAWVHHSRARQWQGADVAPVCSPTFTDWSWPLNMATKGMPVRRVWPAPAHWDAPGYFEGAPAGPFVAADPQPWLVPWGPGFAQGTASPGVDADVGCLIDMTEDGSEGWEILGMRPANPADALGLYARTAPPARTGWLGFLDFISGRAPKARFRSGDFVAEAVHYRTPRNAGRIEGRGAGRIPKRRGVVTFAELQAGVIEHAVSVTMMNFNHGPGGQCRSVAPASRVEHPDRAPNTFTAAVIGYKPGWTVANGQGYAFEWRTGGRVDWLDSRGFPLGSALRRTANTFAVAISTDGYGIEGVETCGYDPQAEATLTPSQWAACGVPDERTCTTLLDGIDGYGRWVALNPAAVFKA